MLLMLVFLFHILILVLFWLFLEIQFYSTVLLGPFLFVLQFNCISFQDIFVFLIFSLVLSSYFFRLLILYFQLRNLHVLFIFLARNLPMAFVLLNKKFIHVPNVLSQFNKSNRLLKVKT